MSVKTKGKNAVGNGGDEEPYFNATIKIHKSSTRTRMEQTVDNVLILRDATANWILSKRRLRGNATDQQHHTYLSTISRRPFRPVKIY